MVRYHWYQQASERIFLSVRLDSYRYQCITNIKGIQNTYSCSGNFTNCYNTKAKIKDHPLFTTSLAERPENPYEQDEILALKLDISEK